MKILITGTQGSIGLGFLGYLSKKNTDIQAELLSLRRDAWREVNLGSYDVVYYCIGIVNANSPDIYRVNTELAFEFAQKAKSDGVKKFIYLSSMAVYDFSGDCNFTSIERGTIADASGHYGKSKWMGEERVKTLADASFTVHIIRAPSIYGRGTEAYLESISAATKWGYFANFQSWKRSILYIDNLSELICLIAKSSSNEIVEYYYPQNKEQYSFSELAEAISNILHTKRRRVCLSPKWEKRLMKIKFIRKKYRPYAYSKEASNAFEYRYCVVNALESIQLALQKSEEK